MADKKLNKEQIAAVRHKKGPLLIIAGAGTGKTTVVTERIKYLIEKDLAKPSEILALTFTEKAAREMEERVDVAMPYGYTQMWISTFHSFCDRVLRAEALHIGLDPRYTLMTESEAIQLIRRSLFKFDLKYFRPLGNPTKFVSGMLQHFSRLQDEDTAPAEYLRWAKSKVQMSKSKGKDSKVESEKWEELAKAYKTYEELKVKEGVMDFGDLIVKTLLLFRERPNILSQYRKQFEYVLVDEFQDTNIAQNELVMLIAGKDGNITVVADDDQSIYKWRGAAVSNVLQFKKNYPKAKLVTLTKNYRSSQEILDKAYKLIQFNNPDRLEVVEKIDKRLKSVTSNRKQVTSKDIDKVKFIHKDRVENEAEEVAKEIVKLVNPDNQVNQERKPNSVNRLTQLTGQLEYRNIAILVRANNHADAFTRALARHNIPYQFLGPGRLFKQPEVVDLISYLKVLYNFEDDASLYRLLSIEHFDIPAKDLVRINNFAKRYNLSLFDALGKVRDIYVGEKTRESVNQLIKLIERHFKWLRRETAGQLLYYFLEDTKLLQKLLNPDTPEAEKRAKNISKFFDKLKTYEIDHEDATVPAVVDWIELATELGESPLAGNSDWTEVNAVNILTVHSAKGLEFPVVFLVNLVGQRFPTIERREQIPIPEELIKEVLPKGDYHEQEERRLFYVGMTRAMEKLYFTAANYYSEGKREKRLSPFIFEALGDEAVASEAHFAVASRAKQLSFLDYQPEKVKKAVVRSPKAESRQKIHLDFLSYSQIQTFEICPLHYKLRYIIRVPTPPSAALSFGSTMHAVMKEFYIGVKSGTRPTARFLYKLLDQNWLSEGYSSKAHEKKMFERGKEYLKKYLKKGFDRKVIPVALEEGFIVPLVTRHKAIGNRPLKIGGKIDRVDRSRDGIEIVDYKTGERVPSQRDVDNDLQLTMYALAATSMKESPFNKAPEDIKLSLYFFEGQEKITTTRTKEQLDNAIKKIFEWREKIETSDFICSKGYICQNNCEYSLMCQSES